MFQQFLDSVQENYLYDNFSFKNETQIVKPILQDEKFRSSVKHWLKNVYKQRTEGPVARNLDPLKLQNGILSKIKKSKNFLEKYNLCNRSLMHLSPILKNYKEIQSKIYYERANILIKSENYNEALESLQMVDLIDKDDIKILYRKALCALKCGNNLIFKENLVKLKKLYDEDESKSDAVKAELEKYRQEYTKLLEKEIQDDSENDEESKGKFEFLTNHHKISIETDSMKGRYILAQKDIDDANQILTETVFAFVPLKPCLTSSSEKSGTSFDCQNCAKSNIIPILCQKCNHAVYCSQACARSHHRIHGYECKGHQIWLWHEIGIAFLAFRTFLEGFDQIKMELDLKLNEKREIEEIMKEIIEMEFDPYKDQYKLLLSLQTHFENMNQGDLNTFAITANILTLYLKTETSFFQDKDLHENENSWEILISSLIFRHIGQMVCNAHTISDMRFEHNEESLPNFMNLNVFDIKSTDLVFRSADTFAGIFPFVSLLNHSCKPNITNRFNGRQLTIKAKGKINEKTEIFNSYGINYLRMSRSERQEILRNQYHFQCKCTECLKSEDEYITIQKIRCYDCKNLLEPVFDLESNEIQPKTSQKCKCGTQFDFEQFDWMHNKITKNLSNVHSDPKNLSTVMRALEYCTKTLHQNHELIYIFSKDLITSVHGTNFEGTSFQSELKSIGTNMLRICEYFYGKNSVEYLIDMICVVKLKGKNEDEILELAENILSRQSFVIFKNILEIVLKN
uniref:Protein-lysine N-methyltransferase SMYD4 n=1 Tax=Culicoides sonorensis TaxID=179676 RepID=A0A336MCZ5_CULSO